jgi:general secretion pathway protein K
VIAPRARDRGYALVTVLWAVTLLAAITMRYQAVARLETALLMTDLHLRQARAVAEAGVWLGIQTAISENRVPSGEAPVTYELSFDGTTIAITIRDVAGLVNLNRAAPDLLAAAFARTALGPAEASAVVDAIADWRDVDTNARGGGREPDAVETSWGPVPVRNGFFRTVDELRAIPGVSDTTYREVRDRFTVFGTHRRINLHAAPRRVLEILAGADEREINEFLAARPDSSPDVLAGLAAPNRRLLQNAGEDIFTVTATATVSGASVTLTPVVRIPRRRNEPVRVLAWGGDAI